MKVKVIEIGKHSLLECGLNNIKLEAGYKYIMGIDGATKHTGVTLYNTTKREYSYTMALDNDINGMHLNENVRRFVRYKMELKAILANLLVNNRQIAYVEYEEPVLSQPVAVPALFSLASTVEEIIVENEEVLKDLHFEIVGNKTWKKILLGDDMPSRSSSEEEKAAVRAYYCKLDKRFEKLSADMMDSMGLARAKDMELHGECKNIESKKKASPFKYIPLFIGTDDDSFEEAIGVYNTCGKLIPNKVRDNGYKMVTMDKAADFDQLVYDSMDGNDIALIVRTESSARGMGKIILRHGLVKEKEYKYIYAIVMRAKRK